MKYVALFAILSSTLWSNSKLEPIFLTNVLLYIHNKEDLAKANLISRHLGEAFKMLRKNPIAIQNESQALAIFPKIETQVVYNKKDTLINDDQVTQRIIAYTLTLTGMLAYNEIDSKVTFNEDLVTEVDFNKGTGECSRKFSREVNGKTIFFSNIQYDSDASSHPLKINYHGTERGTVSIFNTPYVIPYGINSLSFPIDIETPPSIKKIEIYDNPLKQFILDESTLYIPTTLKTIEIHSPLFDVEEITIPTGVSSCKFWRILVKRVPNLQKLTIDIPNKDNDKHIWRCNNHCVVYSGNSFYRLRLPNNPNLFDLSIIIYINLHICYTIYKKLAFLYYKYILM